MTVILPQQTSTQVGMAGRERDGAPPVLYLLHGLSDDDTIWLRRTSIERYVAPLGLAVIMPQVHRSFYTDEACGGRYWTFLSEELPSWSARSSGCPAVGRHLHRRLVDGWLRGAEVGAPPARAVRRRGQPVGCRRHRRPTRPVPTRKIHSFHPGVRRPATRRHAQRRALAARADRTRRAPELWVGCGTEDALYAGNVRFVEACASRGHLRNHLLHRR